MLGGAAFLLPWSACDVGRKDVNPFIHLFLPSLSWYQLSARGGEGLQEQVQSVPSLDVMSSLGGKEGTDPLSSELVSLTTVSITTRVWVSKQHPLNGLSPLEKPHTHGQSWSSPLICVHERCKRT